MIRRILFLVLVATCMLRVSLGADSELDTAAANDGQDVIYLGRECPIFLRLHVQVDGKSYLSVWQEHFDNYFDELDKDNDGILSAEEAGSLPKASADKHANTSIVDKAQSLLKSVGSKSTANASSDKEMTKADVAGYLDEIGQGAFAMTSSRKTPVFAGMGTSQGGPDSIDLFSRLDDDQNGTLSREELRTSGATLHKLDLDDDEMISVEELQPNPYASFLPSQNQQVSSAKVPFFRLNFRDGSQQAVKRLGSQLLKQYDRLDSKTRKKDGRLTRNELNLTETGFRRFDANADAYLNEDELTTLLLEPVPTLEVLVRIGSRNESESPLTVLSDNSTGEVSIRQVSDGRPTVVLDGEQIEFATDRTQSGPAALIAIVRGRFAAADTDSNGYLDQAEVGRSPSLKDVCSRADRDGDRKIFQNELLAHLDERHEASHSRTVLNVLGPNRNLFEILDTNGDRRLSQRELAGAVDRFAAWDRNGDKQLAPSEVPRQYRLSFSRAMPEIGMLSALAAAQDIYSPAQPVEPVGVGPRWFQKMDRNRDGDVSKREFLFEGRLFEQFDTNKNGLIEPSEAALRFEENRG